MPFYNAVDTVVQRLTDGAKSDGVAFPLVNDIAGRQRSLIQRMPKDLLFISFGLNVSLNVANLKSNYSLYLNSHSGMTLGATYAGIPVMNKRCTLRSQREVTHYNLQLKPLFDQILNAETEQESQMFAGVLAQSTADLINTLAAASQAAYSLVVSDADTCTPMAEMSNTDWEAMLLLVGKLEYTVQKVCRLFMQMANNVNVQGSAVDLASNLASATSMFRDLIEGNKANQIPSPPLQSMADKLITAYQMWIDLSSDLTTSVNTNFIDATIVAVFARRSSQLYDSLSAVMDLYVASSVNSTVPGYVISITRRQLVLLEKMAKEALLISYKVKVDISWAALNSTRNTFSSTQRLLLFGAPAADTRPAMNQTDNVCGIQLMKKVADSYHQLEQAALGFASTGSLPKLEELMNADFEAVTAMQAASAFYTSGSVPCAAPNISVNQWKGAIKAVGHVRELSQSVLTAFLFLNMNNSLGSTRRLQMFPGTDLHGTVLDMDTALDNLQLGSVIDYIPAPPIQSLVTQISVIRRDWQYLKQAILSANVSSFHNRSSDVLKVTENLMSGYLAALSESTTDVPGHRIDMTSSQSKLVWQMLNTALLLRNRSSLVSSAELSSTMGEFDALHSQLASAVPYQRTDLTQQSGLTGQAWQSFRSQLDAFAGAHGSLLAGELVQLSASAADLLSQIQAEVELSGIPDPEPPVSMTFPVTMVIFLGIAMFFLLFCARVYCMYRGICLCNNFYRIFDRCLCRRHEPGSKSWAEPQFAHQEPGAAAEGDFAI